MGDTQAQAQRIIGIVGVTFLILIAIFIVIGALNNRDEPEPQAQPTAAPTTAAPPPATPTITCTPAPTTLVQLINQSFTNGETLDNAQAVNAPGDATYIAANILNGNDLISSADVWYAKHGVVYALSSDARRRTLLPDGRDHATAGDQYATTAQGCVT